MHVAVGKDARQSVGWSLREAREAQGHSMRALESGDYEATGATPVLREFSKLALREQHRGIGGEMRRMTYAPGFGLAYNPAAVRFAGTGLTPTIP
jgi:hypothetical protein